MTEEISTPSFFKTVSYKALRFAKVVVNFELGVAALGILPGLIYGADNTRYSNRATPETAAHYARVRVNRWVSSAESFLADQEQIRGVAPWFRVFVGWSANMGAYAGGWVGGQLGVFVRDNPKTFSQGGPITDRIPPIAAIPHPVSFAHIENTHWNVEAGWNNSGVAAKRPAYPIASLRISFSLDKV